MILRLCILKEFEKKYTPPGSPGGDVVLGRLLSQLGAGLRSGEHLVDDLADDLFAELQSLFESDVELLRDLRKFLTEAWVDANAFLAHAALEVAECDLALSLFGHGHDGSFVHGWFHRSVEERVVVNALEVYQEIALLSIAKVKQP
jgi:hypothetical protein